MSARSNEPSGWAGWGYFASLMMMLLGGFAAIAGLVGIFRDQYYVAMHNDVLAVGSYHAWGWVYLVLGIVIFLGGVALLSGAMWARILAVFLAALSLFSNMAFMSAYPLWSIMMITVDILIIYALTVHGHELKP